MTKPTIDHQTSAVPRSTQPDTPTSARPGPASMLIEAARRSAAREAAARQNAQRAALVARNLFD